MVKVEITERSDRGFHNYGAPMECSYGTEIEVYESSASGGPFVWLKMKNRRDMSTELGEAHAHLSEEQARDVIARLQAWLDEIPERWGEIVEDDE